MREMILKTIIEFEEPEQARELAALLNPEDDDQMESLKNTLRGLGEVSFASKKGNVADLLEAPRSGSKGSFVVREASLKGTTELKVTLEGVGDAGWLMGIGLALLADENGGTLQDATLDDPNQKTTFDFLWDGEKARYSQAVRGVGGGDDEDEEEDEDREFDDEDFDEEFRDEDF